MISRGSPPKMGRKLGEGQGLSCRQGGISVPVSVLTTLCREYYHTRTLNGQRHCDLECTGNPLRVITLPGVITLDHNTLDHLFIHSGKLACLPKQKESGSFIFLTPVIVGPGRTYHVQYRESYVLQPSKSRHNCILYRLTFCSLKGRRQRVVVSILATLMIYFFKKHLKLMWQDIY